MSLIFMDFASQKTPALTEEIWGSWGSVLELREKKEDQLFLSYGQKPLDSSMEKKKIIVSRDRRTRHKASIACCPAPSFMGFAQERFRRGLRSPSSLPSPEVNIAMPIEFLSQEQRERYGQFVEDPTSTQLAQYFLLDDRDRQFRRFRLLLPDTVLPP